MSTKNRLDELPVQDGFRMRGLEMTRIETFTDAAFAFALTLLVISFDTIPTSYPELIAALSEIPAFLGSAAIILLFWHAHMTWSRRFGLEDGIAILLSFLLVITVLVYVYPLRYMTATVFALIGHLVGWSWLIPDITLPVRAEVNQLCIIYGIGFSIMCLCIVLLNRHALRRSELLELNALEQFDAKWESRGWLLVGSTGVFSVVLALLLPAQSFTGVPAFTYMLLPIIMPIFGVRIERKRQRFREATGL